MPSATAEGEVIKVSMQNQKTADVKTNVLEKIDEAKTDYPSAMAGEKGKYIFDSIILKKHLRATMKSEQTVDCLKH